MKTPTIEELIASGMNYEKVNGKTMFYVADMKKKFPKAKIKKTDIVESEVGEDKKEHQFVELSNVKF